MRTLPIRKLRLWLFLPALLLFSALSGCANPVAYTAVNRTNTGNQNSASPIPTATLITADLIKEQRELRDRQIGQDISQLSVTPTQYVIDAGDVLSIVVWDHPELANATRAPQSAGISGSDPDTSTTPAAGFIVDYDGMVHFPHAGGLKVAGLTEEQARSLLTTQLARYINQPKVSLRVQSYRSKRVYVDGEVKLPGLQAINDIPMTLIEAINRAGGFLPTGDQSQIMLNRAGTIYRLSFLRLLQKGINPADIMLVNGDVVRVLSRDESKVFVSGEVTVPRALIMHNGHLTLNEALGESGGINVTTGDGRQIYVVRKTTKEPVVYQLDATLPSAMATAEDFELDPKDVVYVAPNGLANWHRGISLLFPSALSSVTGPVR
jgi:polysaccharide export outer membrane protein